MSGVAPRVANIVVTITVAGVGTIGGWIVSSTLIYSDMRHDIADNTLAITGPQGLRADMRSVDGRLVEEKASRVELAERVHLLEQQLKWEAARPHGGKGQGP